MPGTKITGTAAGHKVKLPKVVEEKFARDQLNRIMIEAKVSEEDAQWLLEDGYWGRIMHMVRSSVLMRHASLEEPEDNAD